MLVNPKFECWAILMSSDICGFLVASRTTSGGQLAIARRVFTNFVAGVFNERICSTGRMIRQGDDDALRQ
jgi:hypothetical protein